MSTGQPWDYAINDRRLSLGALGLLVWLLTHRPMGDEEMRDMVAGNNLDLDLLVDELVGLGYLIHFAHDDGHGDMHQGYQLRTHPLVMNGKHP